MLRHAAVYDADTLRLMIFSRAASMHALLPLIAAITRQATPATPLIAADADY